MDPASLYYRRRLRFETRSYGPNINVPYEGDLNSLDVSIRTFMQAVAVLAPEPVFEIVLLY